MGATGGTERHSLALEHALRPMFAYLRALTVPTAVYAASSDWGSRNGDRHALTDRIDRAGQELAGIIAGRSTRERIDPYDNPTPFEELLEGLSGA
jgi:FMN reductase